MSYCTVEMVRRALVPTLDEKTAQQVPTTTTRTAADFTNDQLQDAINEADALIDGYLAGYYKVPVQPLPAPNPDDLGNDNDLLPPHPIDYWSRNIAAYNATLVFKGSLDFQDTDPVARRYKDTLAQLQQVAKGTLTIQSLVPANDDPATSMSGGAGPAVNPYYRGELFMLDEFDLNPPRFDPVYGAGPGGPYSGYGY